MHSNESVTLWETTLAGKLSTGKYSSGKLGNLQISKLSFAVETRELRDRWISAIQRLI